MSRGVIIAGLGGGSGKSVVAVGLCRALANAGFAVSPFKKGPDYIDAGWLGLAARRPCHNLDPFLMDADTIRDSFRRHLAEGGIAVVEGNRGLFDGVDARGGYSTAELARILSLPVVLVVDCTRTTRTVAAMVLGCRMLEPDIEIAGVVLNRIGTERQRRVITDAVEGDAGVPVLGAVFRSRDDVFPQRHLGVTPGPEHADAEEAVEKLAARISEQVDRERIVVLAGECSAASGSEETGHGSGPVIGVLRDSAFQFYYPDNLAALESLGARLVEIDATSAAALPEVDGLYIGGGFPETNGEALAENISFREDLKRLALAGLPVYAECGGLIYLGESLENEGRVYPMSGILPIRFKMEKRPQGHGYTELLAEKDNPFYAPGTVIRGHEFRYSRVNHWDGADSDLVFRMRRGVGFVHGRDGVCRGNVLGLYTHVHALATKEWAEGMVSAAGCRAKERCPEP